MTLPAEIRLVRISKVEVLDNDDLSLKAHKKAEWVAGVLNEQISHNPRALSFLGVDRQDTDDNLRAFVSSMSLTELYPRQLRLHYAVATIRAGGHYHAEPGFFLVGGDDYLDV